MTLTDLPAAEKATSRAPEPGGETEHVRGRPRTSFKRRLVFMMVGSVVVTLVIAVLLTYVWQGSVLTNDAIDRVDAVAEVQEARLEALLADSAEAVALIASRTRLRHAVATHIDDPGPELEEEIGLIVQDAVEASESIEAVTLLDPAGGTIFGTSENLTSDLLPAASLESASGEIVTGLVRLIGDEPVLVSAGPLRLEDRFLGILITAQSVDRMVGLVSDYTGLGDSGETIVAQRDANGDALFVAPLRFEADATLVRTVGRDEVDVPMTSALAGVETNLTRAVDYRGEEVFASTRYLPSADWGVVVKLDVAEALAPLYDFTRTSIFALIAIVGIAAVVAWWGATGIAGPVARLTEVASAIAAGDRARRVPVERDDELGQLAEDFNSMTSQLIAATEHLEGEVELRTAELTHKNEQLERLMEQKEMFLASVSHELRTPLSAVVGFIDLLSDPEMDVSDEQRQEFLVLAGRQAEEVSTLIEDLLVSARVQSGTLRVSEVSVDLVAQVSQVLEGLDSDLSERIEVSGGLANGQGDPARVRQVIRNLVTNAGRYAGPNITIDTSQGEDWVKVCVVDDGPGIPELDRERVFSPYEQSQHTKRTPGSVGLGLCISRELARRMGGDLVYSYSQERSVFDLILPPAG